MRTAAFFVSTLPALSKDIVVLPYKLLTVGRLLVLVLLQDNGAQFLDDAFLDEQLCLVLILKLGDVGMVGDEHGFFAADKPFG